MKYYIPSALLAVVILVLSSGPGINLPESWWDLLAVDKLGHFVIYGALTAALFWGYYKDRAQFPPIAISHFFFWGSVLYGIGMEAMQFFFFPGRYFEVLDIIANIIGSSTGLFLFRYLFIKNP